MDKTRKKLFWQSATDFLMNSNLLMTAYLAQKGKNK
jgi:hypothetical protein